MNPLLEYYGLHKSKNYPKIKGNLSKTDPWLSMNLAKVKLLTTHTGGIYVVCRLMVMEQWKLKLAANKVGLALTYVHSMQLATGQAFVDE